jgi:hypothetical protein
MMKKQKQPQTGFNPNISHCNTTNSAFFYREDTADTASLSSFMIYSELPIKDIVQVENEVKLENA